MTTTIEPPIINPQQNSQQISNSYEPIPIKAPNIVNYQIPPKVAIIYESMSNMQQKYFINYLNCRDIRLAYTSIPESTGNVERAPSQLYNQPIIQNALDIYDKLRFEYISMMSSNIAGRDELLYILTNQIRDPLISVLHKQAAIKQLREMQAHDIPKEQSTQKIEHTYIVKDLLKSSSPDDELLNEGSINVKQLFNK